MRRHIEASGRCHRTLELLLLGCYRISQLTIVVLWFIQISLMVTQQLHEVIAMVYSFEASILVIWRYSYVPK